MLIIRLHSLLVVLFFALGLTLSDKTRKSPVADRNQETNLTPPPAKSTPAPIKSRSYSTPIVPFSTPIVPFSTPIVPFSTPIVPFSTPFPTSPSTTTHVPYPVTDWAIKENNTVCIIANINVNITVPYMTKDNKTITAEFDLMNTQNATASGTCGEHNQTLVLLWNKSNISSTFTFDHKNGSDTYSLSAIEFTFPVNDCNFMNNSMVNVTAIRVSLNSAVFVLTMNHSYSCTNLNTLSLQGTALNGSSPVANTSFDANLILFNVHVEAFRKTNTTKYNTTQDCYNQNHTFPIEEIIAAVVLILMLVCLLLIIVIVAKGYIVDRRNPQVQGYNTME